MRKKSWPGRLTLMAALAVGGCSGGSPPLNPGLHQGRLAPCPDSPNCVSSQAAEAARRIDPLHYAGDPARARDQLLAVLRAMERVRIVRADGDYIHAEFRSALFGFVDDVEFHFAPPGALQARSAARAGYYDFGVNRERLEDIRARFDAARKP